MRRRPEIPYPLTLNCIRNTVLVFVERDGKYLMLHRRRTADVRKGVHCRWSAVRALKTDKTRVVPLVMKDLVKEEIGVEPTKWRYHGVIEFYYDTDETICHFLERIYAFTVTDWDGEIVTESPKGTYKWIKKERVPKLHLWRGDKVFLRAMERGLKFFFIMLCYDYKKGYPLNDAAVNQKRVPLEDWDV